MGITTVNDNQATMPLGEVTINNQRYMAILHFKTDGGENRPITANMINTREVALRHFQTVVASYTAGNNITFVSSAGFHDSDACVSTHEDMQTEIVWQHFIYHLENPILDEDEDELLPTGTHVELVNLKLLNDIEDKQKFGRDLYLKIKDTQGNDFPELTETEKLFLKHEDLLYKYTEFLAGRHSAEELNRLFLEFPAHESIG